MKLKNCSECPYVGVLFKSNPPLCPSCARKTFKPLSRSVEPIAKHSASRKIENKAYLTLRKVYLENHQYCNAQVNDNCTGKATEIHHKCGRIGKLLTEVHHFLPTCRNCHDWIENSPLQAKEMGLSDSRLNK